MNEEIFWSFIDQARGEGAGPQSPSADPESLRTILEAESDETVSAFGLRFYEEVARLNQWSLRGAGYVIDGGMSDDSFHYFRSWLIGKGRTAVEQALRDPDGLVEYIEDPQGVDNELLEYVAVEIMESRGGEDPRNAFSGERGPDDAPEGIPFDEESVDNAYPRLAARFTSAD